MALPTVGARITINQLGASITGTAELAVNVYKTKLEFKMLAPAVRVAEVELAKYVATLRQARDLGAKFKGPKLQANAPTGGGGGSNSKITEEVRAMRQMDAAINRVITQEQ